jgi:threonine/homoserine/homoserine lactone efflux protein
MRTEVFAAMAAFCFVSGATPGPNNLMLMTSGVNFGFRRTLPHLFGVVLGFCVMVALVGVGLDAIFSRFPALLPAMRYLGAAYMLWLAWKIAFAGPVRDGQARGAPLGFFGAAAFQWINPKAWVMAVTALTAYSVVDNYTVNVIIIALVCLAVGLPSSGSWAMLGSGMRRALANPRIARPFNFTMAALLIASIVPIFTEG